MPESSASTHYAGILGQRLRLICGRKESTSFPALIMRALCQGRMDASKRTGRFDAWNRRKFLYGGHHAAGRICNATDHILPKRQDHRTRTFGATEHRRSKIPSLQLHPFATARMIGIKTGRRGHRTRHENKNRAGRFEGQPTNAVEGFAVRTTGRFRRLFLKSSSA